MIAKIPYLPPRDNSTRKTLLYCLGFFFILEFLVKNIGISDSGKYLIELTFLYFLCRGVYRPTTIHAIGINVPVTFIFLMLLELAVSTFVNSVSIGNTIVGILGHYLGFGVFLIATYVMTVADFKKLFRIFYYYQFVNLGTSLYQYLTLGYYQDLNNGAFTGGATQDFFCGILIVYYYTAYIRHEEPFRKCVFVLLSCFTIAVLQEEKFILAEIAIVVLYQAIIGKKNFKNLMIIIIFVMALPIVITKIGDINGEYASESLSSTTSINENLTDAGAGYGFPRVGSLPLISAMFFHNTQEELLGLGCGICENTTLSFADTYFIERYGHLNYYQYPIQLTFLQTGLIGVILYVGFFVSLLVYNIKRRFFAEEQYKTTYDLAVMINIICIALIWYNQTLKWYYAIMPFLFLSLGPTCTRQIKYKEI